MPGHSLKRTAKFPAEGASDIRGALTEVTPVKKERNDNATTQLRNNIINRRKQMGLDVETEHLFHKSPIKHELTPAELEKRERRKEQNRRAARKCRQKKKLQQAVVGEDFHQMLKDNKLMEKEILTLRAEKATLEKTLADHLESGSCKNIKVESPGCAVVPSSPATAHNTVTPLSPSPSPSVSLYSSTASPHIVLDPVSPPATTTTSTAQFENDMFNSDAYLQDLGPISPDQTFTDLEMLPDISEMVSLDFEELGSLSDTIAANIPSRLTSPPPYHQLIRSEPSTAPSPLPGSTSWTAGDPMESLKTLMPAKACGHVTLQLGGSASPLQDASHMSRHYYQPAQNHDRHSVSSVASDLSGWSDRSQGFAVVPTGMGSPLGPATGRGDGCVAASHHNPHASSSTTTICSSSSEPADDPQEASTMGCSLSSQIFWSHGLAAPNSASYYSDGGMGGFGYDEEDDDDVFHNVNSTGVDENIFQQYVRKQ